MQAIGCNLLSRVILKSVFLLVTDLYEMTNRSRKFTQILFTDSSSTIAINQCVDIDWYRLSR